MFGTTPSEEGSAAAGARPVDFCDTVEDEELLIDFNDSHVSQKVSPTLFILSVQTLTMVAQFQSFQL
jgi:hypothetical protein